MKHVLTISGSQNFVENRIQKVTSKRFRVQNDDVESLSRNSFKFRRLDKSRIQLLDSVYSCINSSLKDDEADDPDTPILKPYSSHHCTYTRKKVRLFIRNFQGKDTSHVPRGYETNTPHISIFPRQQHKTRKEMLSRTSDYETITPDSTASAEVKLKKIKFKQENKREPVILSNHAQREIKDTAFDFHEKVFDLCETLAQHPQNDCISDHPPKKKYRVSAGIPQRRIQKHCTDDFCEASHIFNEENIGKKTLNTFNMLPLPIYSPLQSHIYEHDMVKCQLLQNEHTSKEKDKKTNLSSSYTRTEMPLKYFDGQCLEHTYLHDQNFQSRITSKFTKNMFIANLHEFSATSIAIKAPSAPRLLTRSIIDTCEEYFSERCSLETYKLLSSDRKRKHTFMET